MRAAARKTRAMTDNAAWKGAKPALSVLIPFFRDDPTDLIQALDEDGRSLDGSVELVVLDDGTGDEALAERVRTAVLEARTPPAGCGLSSGPRWSSGG